MSGYNKDFYKKINKRNKYHACCISAGAYIRPEKLNKEIIKEIKKLNYLLVLTYGYTFEGKLIPPGQGESTLLDSASEAGVNSLFVLTPFSEGAFHNQLVRTLVESREIQDRVIKNICEIVGKKGYAGTEVELEYVQPGNRLKFADFIGRLREKMNEAGKIVSVSVAAKMSDYEKGLVPEGIDYRALGINADQVCIAAYGWGGIYGAPAPAAPLDKVRKTVEYAVGRISSDKLYLSIPGFGYDWLLPYERGFTRAKKVSNEQAQALAEEYKAEIQYAEIAQTPWFTYKSGGMEHVVWFENEESIRAKINLAVKYGLAGTRCREFLTHYAEEEESVPSVYVRGIHQAVSGV